MDKILDYYIKEPELIDLYSKTSLNRLDKAHYHISIFGGVLPENKGDSFPILTYIDPYQDTYFTSFQMNAVIDEIKRILTDDIADSTVRVAYNGEKHQIIKVRELLEILLPICINVKQAGGVYLCFIGD